MNAQQTRLLVTAMWGLTIFFSVFPSLVVFLLKSDDPFCRKHSIQALHYIFVAYVLGFIAWVLKIILIGYVLVYLISAITIAVCLYGAFQAFSGKEVKIFPAQYLLLK